MYVWQMNRAGDPMFTTRVLLTLAEILLLFFRCLLEIFFGLITHTTKIRCLNYKRSCRILYSSSIHSFISFKIVHSSKTSKLFIYSTRFFFIMLSSHPNLLSFHSLHTATVIDLLSYDIDSFRHWSLIYTDWLYSINKSAGIFRFRYHVDRTRSRAIRYTICHFFLFFWRKKKFDDIVYSSVQFIRNSKAIECVCLCAIAMTFGCIYSYRFRLF